MPRSIPLAVRVGLVLGAFLGLVPGFGPALAAPTVSIKARTEIRLDPIRRSYDGITVAGRIADRFSDEAVPWVYIRVQLDATERLVTADKDGGFRVSLQVAEGSHQLTVEFLGDDRYARTSFHANSFDVSKEPLALSVSADPTVDASSKAAHVTIKARVDQDGVAINLTVRVARSAPTKKHASPSRGATHTVRTDGTGRAELDIPRASLGAPGRKRIDVSFPGDDTYDAASATTSFVLVTGSELAFELRSRSVSHSSRIKGRGRLADMDGAPIPGAPVVLLVGSNRVAETLTKPDGSFELSVAASELGAGKFNVQAVFDSTQSWRRSARSTPAAVTIAEPQPVPIGYTLAAFGATAFALLAFVGLRAKPWTRWHGWRRRHTPDETEDEDERIDDEPVRTGLAPARPGLVSTLRRAADHGFSGTVNDAVRSRPLAEARIAVSQGDGSERHTDSATDGGFTMEQLAAGEWRVRVTRHGYVAEEFSITLPHRGELRGARVDLMPVRERIFVLYREVAEPLLPTRDLWGVWTPRQIFDHVRERHQAQALRRLTDFVEDSYFSQRIPTEAMLADTRQLVDAALREAATPG